MWKRITNWIRKDVDPEEEPGFLERNPTWEDELPPIHPVDHDSILESDSKSKCPVSPKVAANQVFVPSAPKTELLPEGRELARKRWRIAYVGIKRELALKKQAVSSSVGFGAQMRGKSYGIFGANDKRRLVTFKLVFNQWNEYFLLAITIIQCAAIVFKCMAYESSNMVFDVRALNIVDAVCTLIFSLDCNLRIFCLGFVVGETSYLRSDWNKLDFFSTIDSWVQLCMGRFTGRDSGFRLATLRIFRHLTSLHDFEFFSSVLAIMEAIQQSMRPLYDVSLLSIVLLSVYGLFANLFFEGDLRMRCVRMSDNQSAYPEQFCNLADRGFNCPVGQVCVKGDNPNYGGTDFDIFPKALLTLFEVISLEGWAALMFMIEEADVKLSDAFFISLVIVCSYFLVNILVAAISGIFLRVRMEHQVLLKKKRREDALSFYNATVLARTLKDIIRRDDSQTGWFYKLKLKVQRIQTKLTKARRRYESHKKHGVSPIPGHSWSNHFFHYPGKSDVRGIVSHLHVPANAWSDSKVASNCEQIVESDWFNYLVLVCVSANFGFQCLYHDNMTVRLLRVIRISEGIFLAIFVVEMIFRFIANGAAKFLHDRMNIFDTLVIAVSIGSTFCGYATISSARIMRWFYTNKHDGRNPSIMTTCIKGMGALCTVAFFYILVIFVFSIMGMELYAGQYSHFSDGYPRANFDSLPNAMLLWFTVTTGELWINNMWNAMRPGVAFKWAAPFIFIAYFVLTGYIIINLIIAVILEHSELTDTEKKKIQKDEFIKFLKKRKTIGTTRGGTWVLDAFEGAQAGIKGLSKRLNTMRVTPISIYGKSLRLEKPGTPEIQQTPETVAEYVSDSEKSGDIRPPSNIESGVQPTDENLESFRESHRPTRRASQIIRSAGFPDNISEQAGKGTVLRSTVISLVHQENLVAQRAKAEQDESTYGREKSLSAIKSIRNRASFVLAEFEGLMNNNKPVAAPWFLDDTSFFIFSPENCFRKLCKAIIESGHYAKIYLFVVAFSIYLLSLDDSQGAYVIAQQPLHIVNCIIIGFFTADVLLNCVSYGFLLTPEPYTGHLYNVLDVAIVVTDLLGLFQWGDTMALIVRVFHSFRPLRVINRFHGIATLFQNLALTLPAISSVVSFAILTNMAFGIVGIQLFRGMLKYCTDDDVIYREECVGNFINDSGILSPRVWDSPKLNFDNIGNAIMSLYVVSTFDNWVSEQLYPMMDITVRNKQPELNSHPLNALYLIFFVCLAGYFGMRMLVGVFIDQFGMISGSKLLTERQKLWRDTNRIIQYLKPVHIPEEPKGGIRKKIYRFVRSRLYGRCVVVTVILNYIFLATRYSGQPLYVTLIRRTIGTCFFLIYVVDLCLMLIALGFRSWMRDWWNIYEFVLVLGAGVCVYPEPRTPRDRVGKFFKIMRIFRLFRYIPRLNTLARTVVCSLTSMLDIFALLFINLLVFAAMGVQLFANIKAGTCINRVTNFRSFTNAFVTVFQITTNDNWSCIWLDTSVQEPNCTKGRTMGEGDCGSRALGIVYFFFLNMSTTLIFMNLFVAGILDTITFGLLHENTIITPTNLTDFQELWSDPDFDPRGDGYIGLHKLRSFVTRLGAPLGRRHNAAALWYARIEWEVLCFHIPNKGVPFKELLETLTLYKIGSRGLELVVRIEREKRIIQHYRYGATIKIQALVRGFLQRRNLKRALEQDGH